MERIKEQGRWLREEMEGMRRDMKEQAVRWKEERMEMMEIIKGLERRVKKLETAEKEGEEGERGIREDKGRERIKERVKDIERKIELKERADRKRNIIIKGLEVKEGKRREAVKETFKRIKMRAEIEEVKRLGGDKDKGREVVWVRLGNEVQKRKVMEMKKKLRGRKERILEDWTWKKRKMR